MSSSRRNSDGIAGRIRQFLEARPEGVTSGELVREVFALRNVTEGLAEKLVRTAAGGDPAIICGPDGRWRLRPEAEKTLAEADYLCLAMRQSVDNRYLSVGWCWLAEGRIGDSGKQALGKDEIEQGVDLPAPKTAGQVACVVFRRRVRGMESFLRGVRRRWGTGMHVWEARAVGRALFPFASITGPEELAAALGERWLESDDPQVEACSLARVWQRAVELASETGVVTSSDLRRLLVPTPLDFGRFRFGPEKLHSLPARPGVYTMFDERGEVVYVGKAANLAARVSSYFRPRELLSERDQAIVDAIVDFDVIPLGSELEALLTEYRLIGLYRPRLNQQVSVHPREHWQNVRKDWAIVLPSAAPGCAEVFLLNRGGQIRQIRCDVRMSNEAQLLAEIQALFFSREEQLGVHDEGEIAFTWLASRQPWDFVLEVSRWTDERDGVRRIATKVREVIGAAVGSGVSSGVGRR